MPGYRTKQESIAILGTDCLLIRSLLDRQQYADPCGEAAAVGLSSATWPLFGLPWASGLQLASAMAARPVKPGERILEVGCGLALASLVCHRRGVDVTASDCHPLAPGFLTHNARLNELPPLSYRHGDWRCADGRREAIPGSVHGRFDVIMGSDVLYERDDDGHLAAFVEQHSMPAAQVLIVDPNRGNRSAFARRLAAHGFSLHTTALRTPAADGTPFNGRLLHFSRASAD